MKKNLITAIIVLLAGAMYQSACAQGLLDRMKQKAKDKINQRIDKKTDKAMDNALDQSDPSKPNGSKPGERKPDNTSEATHSIAAYKNYDFVPGDKIIFESQLADERPGEIPSQFELTKGQVDVQVEDGENVIHIAKGPDASITPRMTEGSILPDAFTLEFDYKNEQYGVNHVNVDFGFRVGTYGPDNITTGIGFNDRFANWTLGNVNYADELLAETKKPMEWHHVAIAINKNAGKAYVDQFRVANVNNLKGRHDHVNIELIGYENGYIKNIRIAAGGIDLYKRVTTDAKLITHGILFDVDKASLQPTSMGTINTIYTMLKSNAALKFEIDGHTDNTGAAVRNLTLSKLRADAVKTQLVSMGIEEARLTTKGFGDSKPISDNNTPEGKANNRRVEFVKI